jgi:hypothetical protein
VALASVCGAIRLDEPAAIRNHLTPARCVHVRQYGELRAYLLREFEHGLSPLGHLRRQVPPGKELTRFLSNAKVPRLE